MVAGQPAERYKNRQLTSTSQVQIGSSSRANNNTSLKSQPRYGLHQGPYKLTIKENPNAKNKMEVPAPTKVCLVLICLFVLLLMELCESSLTWFFIVF